MSVLVAATLLPILALAILAVWLDWASSPWVRFGFGDACGSVEGGYRTPWRMLIASAMPSSDRMR